MSGPIPSVLGLMKSLVYIHFSQNFLSGHIPSTISNLSQLKDLDLSSNLLNGSIPPIFGFHEKPSSY